MSNWRSEIRQEGGCGIVCRISCGNSLRTVEMKRTELIKAVRAGTLSNVTPMHPGQSRKQVPDNSGEKYFKWDCKTRMLLLTLCLHKEVWKHPLGKKSKVHQDVCTVLKSSVNYEEVFSNLTWHIGFYLTNFFLCTTTALASTSDNTNKQQAIAKTFPWYRAFATGSLYL